MIPFTNNKKSSGVTVRSLQFIQIVQYTIIIEFPSHTGWGPPVISWFRFTPLYNYSYLVREISTINQSFYSATNCSTNGSRYKPELIQPQTVQPTVHAI